MLLKKLFNLLRKDLIKFCKPIYYGFILGHHYLSRNDLKYIKSFVGKKDQSIINSFENNFASLIGKGKCISYASARMGFYEIMKAINIGKGDEVVLLGFTCSVMANAIIKREAIPIYSDLDKDTYGSSNFAIEKCISSKTKMIVAQHSFGIPCNVIAIKKFAEKHNIFLLEDCALTLGSKISNQVVGNFGDAAIFSTDHTKPINTMTGGLVYSQKEYLIKRLKISQKLIPEISFKKQLSLYNQIKIEKYFCNPKNNGKFYIFNLIMHLKKKFLKYEEPYLCDDFSTNKISSYPYPASIPTFLAVLGIMEISRWEVVKAQRLCNLRLFLKCSEELNISIPKAYKNRNLEIVPLRFSFELKESRFIEKSLSKIIDIESFWFRLPLIGSKEPLENFYYKKGCCPESEFQGKCIINLPCNLDSYNTENLCKILKNCFMELQNK